MGSRQIAIIGAGPVGLEAALHARRLGHGVIVFEAGAVGEHFRRYGPVRLFTPFHMNSTEWGRERLRSAGVSLPAHEDVLAAEELRERYLVPLARLPEIRDRIAERARVTGIAREGLEKTQSIVATGDRLRETRRFLLRVESERGEARFERADVVIDASGVYRTPNAAGPGGLPALGEESLGSRLERHLPPITREARGRYAGKRILLIGDGRSAASALVDLDALVREGGDGAGTRVEWIHRDRGGAFFAPVPEQELDRLPSLRDLDTRANRIAREAPWLRRRPGAVVAAYRALASGAVEAALADAQGKEEPVEVDRVLALVGYRPDLSLFRELQVHLCYASEGPMALSSAILTARMKHPGAADGCLAQTSHGPETLKSPEPDFYVLGAKSYGRNPNFLLSLGHRQIADVFTLIGAVPGVPDAAR